MPRSIPEATTSQSRPNPLSMLVHFKKSMSLIGAVLGDTRIHPLRKFLFLGGLIMLLALLVFPEALADVATALVPVFGAIGVPIELGGEAGFDWLAMGVAAFSLLHVFPAGIVGEHYDRIFHQGR